MLSRSLLQRAARVLGAVPRGIILDADTLELVAEIDAGGRDGDIVASVRGAWVSTYEHRSLTHVGPDGETLLHVELPARPQQLALDGDSPLVRCASDRLLRVDPLTGQLVTDVAAPPETSAVGAGEGRVWVLVADQADSSGWRLTLAQLDPLTLRVMGSFEVGRSRFFGHLCVSEGTVSVLHETAGGMAYASFDAASGLPRATPEALTRPVGIGTRDGVRFVHADRRLRRLDARTGEELSAEKLPVPRAARFVLAHGRLWAVAWRPSSGRDSASLQ